VEVRTSDGQLIILDCGTGARGLGQALLASGEKALKGHILLSHTHWDHIQGFPFFGPIYLPGNDFTLYSARATSKPLQAVFSGQLDYLYFPVSLRQLAASLQFRELAEEEFRIGETKVRTISLNHTVLTLGYRLEDGKHSIAYITDHEPYSRYYPKWGITGRSPQSVAPSTTVPRIGSFAHDQDQRLADFVEGVDLLIQDSQYLEVEYPSHMGGGHSTID
jgi:phosphoribosyl 1,2-cyclic phosphodiesterase